MDVYLSLVTIYVVDFTMSQLACHQCNYKTLKRYNLNRHIRLVHGSTTDEGSDVAIPSISQPPVAQSVDEKKKTAYIYILQDGGDKGTNIFKIGKTVQTGDDTRRITRLTDYQRGTIVYAVLNVPVDLVDVIERSIKQKFIIKYKLIRGSEWFIGNVESMKQDVISEIAQFCPVKVNNPYSQYNVSLFNICMQCDKVFASETALKNHMHHYHSSESSGTNDGTEECSKCKKLYSSAKTLKKHLQICKGVIDPLECQECGKKFKCLKTKYNHKTACKLKVQSNGEGAIIELVGAEEKE